MAFFVMGREGYHGVSGSCQKMSIRLPWTLEALARNEIAKLRVKEGLIKEATQGVGKRRERKVGAIRQTTEGFQS